MQKWLVGLLMITVSGGCAAPTAEEEDVDVTLSTTTPRANPQPGPGPILCPPYCLPTIPDHEVRILPTITNSTTESTAHVTPIIINAIRAKLANDSNIDVDEGSDPTTSSDALAVRGNLKSVAYLSGNLQVKVELTVFRYPSMSLVGTVPGTLTIGGQSPNQTAEDTAIRVAAGVATKSFIDHIDDFN